MTFCYMLPVERPYKCSEIISQHTGTPHASVPLFHCGNVLVKSFSVLIAHWPEIFWKEV